MSEAKCPKCGGEMQQGFVPDCTYGGPLTGRWFPGPPRRGWLAEITALNLRSGIPIGAFRCAGCGYLEFYADGRFASK